MKMSGAIDSFCHIASKRPASSSTNCCGETPRSAGFCAHQLGHGSEQMVHAVYKKAGVEERVATLQLAAAMEEARRVAVGA